MVCLGDDRRRPIGTCLQTLDLLSESGQPRINVAVASARFDLANEPIEPLLNPSESGFERGIASLTCGVTRLGLADLFGNPTLGLSLAADQ
jgi:hypothetical protein